MNRWKLLALATMAVMAAACGTGSDTVSPDTGSTQTSETDAAPVSGEERLSIVVTTTIWGDIVSNVTGADAVVEVLFPIGADSHDHQLSAAQVASMQRADLVLVNGLALEQGILDVIESLDDDGANVFAVAGLLDPIPFGDGGHGQDEHPDEEGEHADEDGECDAEAGHDEEDDGHSDEEGEDTDEHGHSDASCDPHTWMDPLRVADAVELIAKELADLDSSVDWMANATAYSEELQALDTDVESMLATVPADRRKMVTNHEAFGYFAARYGFELVGAVIPGGSTLADPSSAELAELVQVMIDENVGVIFAETVEPAILAEAVAAEVGEATVVELFTESLGGPGSGAETYIDLIRTNATRIADALS